MTREVAKEIIERWKTWHASRKLRVTLNVLALVVVLSIGIYWELPKEPAATQNKCEIKGQSEDIETISPKIASLATGYRGVRSQRTTLILLKRTTDPGLIVDNVCEQRWYISQLVSRLESLGAASVVLDKFFGADACPQNDLGTANLISTVRSIEKMPIVIGKASHSPDTDPNGACLIADESLDFGNKASTELPVVKPAVKIGLIRLNSSIEKIPLIWYCYKNEASFKTGEDPSTGEGQTLSWIAASSVDPYLERDSTLSHLRSSGYHPMTSFITLDNFTQVDALPLLCSSVNKSQVQERYHISCVEPPPNESYIRGRTIVIGEDVQGRDRHRLYDLDVPGAYLQANYIESLLDGRYLRPLGSGWDISILVAWIIFLYSVFWWAKPELALAYSLAIALLLWLAMAQLTVWKGIYSPIFLEKMVVIAIFLKYIDSRGQKLVEAIREL